MLRDEKNLLENLEKLKEYKITHLGPKIDFPNQLFAANYREYIRNPQESVLSNGDIRTKEYCNDLKKTEANSNQLIKKFNEIVGQLNLDIVLIEEVPEVISSEVSDFLDTSSTENVIFRLKDMDDIERNLM